MVELRSCEIWLPLRRELQCLEYRFLGWSTSSNSKSPNYLPGDAYTSNANITLYAVWEQLGILHINQGNTWVKGKVWIKVDGVWRTGLVYTKVNNEWRQGGV